MMAQLVVLNGRHANQTFRLDNRIIFDIGSADNAAIRLTDGGISPSHCRLYRENDRYTIFDLSGAGIRVNGKKTQKAILSEGDDIYIGNTNLRFTAKANAGPSKAAPNPSRAAPQASGPILEVIEGADKGKTFPLSNKKYVLGRGVTADIIVMDIKCSREHCAVDFKDGNLVLQDLGATNHTRLNGRKLPRNSRQPLKHGDKIKLGYSVFVVHWSKSQAPAMATTEQISPFGNNAPRGKKRPTQSPRAPTNNNLRGPSSQMPNAQATAKRGPSSQGPGQMARPTSQQTGGQKLSPKSRTQRRVRRPTSQRLGASAPPPTPPANPPQKKDGFEFTSDAFEIDFGGEDKPGSPPAGTHPNAKPKTAPKPSGPNTGPNSGGDKGDPALRTFVFDDQMSFDEPKTAPKPAAKTNSEQASLADLVEADKQGGEEKDASLRTFVFDDQMAFDEPKADKEPAPTPKPEPQGDPALRTFVFDDQMSFDDPKTAAKAENKAKPADIKTGGGEDAALRTFVFDDQMSFDDSSNGPSTSKPPAGEQASLADLQAADEDEYEDDEEDEVAEEKQDASLRTFVFDDQMSFDDKTKPEPEPEPKDAGDAALRTFVFDDQMSFDDDKSKAKAETKAKPADIKTGGGEDAALRTFVFDDQMSFDDSSNGPGASKPPAGEQATLADLQAADEDEYEDDDDEEEVAEEKQDASLRTFVFDDQMSFDEDKSKPEKKDAGDAALRTFVFDDQMSFDDSKSKDDEIEVGQRTMALTADQLDLHGDDDDIEEGQRTMALHTSDLEEATDDDIEEGQRTMALNIADLKEPDDDEPEGGRTMTLNIADLNTAPDDEEEIEAGQRTMALTTADLKDVDDEENEDEGGRTMTLNVADLAGLKNNEEDFEFDFDDDWS